MPKYDYTIDVHRQSISPIQKIWLIISLLDIFLAYNEVGYKGVKWKPKI